MAAPGPGAVVDPFGTIGRILAGGVVKENEPDYFRTLMEGQYRARLFSAGNYSGSDAAAKCVQGK